MATERLRHCRVMDCTVRDGGLTNNWQFSLETVRNIYRANVAAGIEYMEIGYAANPKLVNPEGLGVWRFCRPGDIYPVIDGIEGNIKLSVMADIGRATVEDLPDSSDSPVHLIRVACYSHQMEEAIQALRIVAEKGYEAALNIMAISRCSRKDLLSSLDLASQVDSLSIIYVVDSFGSMDMEDVSELVSLYAACCPETEIGFHGHNNQQLALANTITAAGAGAEYLDASYFGMGRGAGNCPLELLIAASGEKYSLDPVLPVIQHELEPLVQELKWGYQIPYLISAAHNQHPRKAISFMKEKGKNYNCFLDESRETEMAVR